MGQVAGTRVGIVGTGWMAETHTEALRRLGVDVAGVAGRTPARAREVAGRLGLVTWTAASESSFTRASTES